MVFQIGYPAGLLALAILIPLIIIYLRRPRALVRAMPSLMFFSEHRGRLRSSSFFRRFVRNILFIIQFIVLALLAFSCSQPAVTNDQLVFLQHTVLVLDTSASMTPSIEALRSEAMRNVAAETSIIIATAPMEVILERGTPDRAYLAIQEIAATDRRADLSGAVLRAVSIADTTSSRIIVITDRRSSLSDTVVELAQNRGQSVSIIDVSVPIDDNVGFVDARVSAYEVDAAIRAFGDARTVTISGPSGSFALEVPERGVRRIALPLAEGENVFTIEPQDMFSFDSTLSIANSARSRISALIVSIADGTIPVERALRAMNLTTIDIARNRLGTISEQHDLIVLSDYSTELLLPSFYSEVSALVESGSLLVIGKNARIASIPDELMPVSIEGTLQGSYPVVSQGSMITDAVEFSEIVDPLDARLRNGSISIARSGDAQIIAIKPKGAGAIIYYGYDDRSDAFVSTPYYPILWSNIVEEITGARSVGRFNVETGTVRPLPQPLSVTYPDGSSVIADSIPFDRTGFYRVEDVVFAANVLDAAESDPAYVLDALTGSGEGSQRSRTRIPLTGIIAVIALVLLLLELFILKRRGDL